MSEGFVGALLGALIGGGATLLAAWFSIRHERYLNRALIEAEHEQARTSVARQAVAELLEVLTVASDSLPILVQRRWRVSGRTHVQNLEREWHYEDWTKTDKERIDGVLTAMRRGRAAVHLVPSAEIRARWHRAYDFFLALAYQSSSRSSTYASPELVQEMAAEVRAYLTSTEDALSAYLDDRRLPPEQLPPDFTDESVSRRFQVIAEAHNQLRERFEEAKRKDEERAEKLTEPAAD